LAAGLCSLGAGKFAGEVLLWMSQLDLGLMR
jgi:hypothetical protein